MPKKSPPNQAIFQPTSAELETLQIKLSSIYEDLLYIEQVGQEGLKESRYNNLLKKFRNKVDKAFGTLVDSQGLVGEIQARASALEARGNPRDRLIMGIKERMELLQTWLDQLEGQ